jgi:flagellar biosynthetic protein FliO
MISDGKRRLEAGLQALAAQNPALAARLRRLPGWAWGLLAAGMIVAGLLAGAEPAPQPGPGLPAGSVPAGNLFDTAALGLDVLLKLGVVIGLIYACLYLLKRWRGPLGAAGRRLAVLETTRLSTRQSLHLVRVGSQVLLIGATDGGLSLLAELDEAGEAGPAVEPAGEAFAGLLQRQAGQPLAALDLRGRP